jgi:hypothetical protein
VPAVALDDRAALAGEDRPAERGDLRLGDVHGAGVPAVDHREREAGRGEVLAGTRDDILVQIDGRDAPSGADQVREQSGVVAGAGADLEHPLAGLEPKLLEHDRRGVARSEPVGEGAPKTPAKPRREARRSVSVSSRSNRTACGGQRILPGERAQRRDADAAHDDGRSGGEPAELVIGTPT